MPRVVDHAERRQEIVRAVWWIIAEAGIAGVTLRAIAARAGISMGRVQHYFPTRDAIVLHGLTAMIDTAQEEFPLPEDPAGQLRVLLTHAIPRTDGQRLGAKVWYAYLAEGATDPAIAEIVREALQDNEDRATTLLSGDRDAARVLLAAADGIAYRALVGQISPDEAEAAVERLITSSRRPRAR